MANDSGLCFPYPKVVVRWMATVYQGLGVYLGPPREATLLPMLREDGWVRSGRVVLRDPDPDAGDEWTDKRREALVAAATQLSQLSRFHVSVVFDKRDCVYIEPDGTQKRSDEPPSGGIDATTGNQMPLADYAERRRRALEDNK